MNKSNLDEMQLQLRNRIGNQSFLLLMYILLIDVGLYGFGFRWISYPANIVIILTIVSGSYVVRLILSNAYAGTSYKEQNTAKRSILMAVLIAIAAAMMAFFIKSRGIAVESTNDGGAIILVLASIVSLSIIGISSFIKHRQNKDDEK